MNAVVELNPNGARDGLHHRKKELDAPGAGFI
jgi:hypothetical protein